MKKPYKVFGGPTARLRSFALLEWAKPYAEQVYHRKENTYQRGSPVEIWLWQENPMHSRIVATFDANGWKDIAEEEVKTYGKL